MQKFIFVLLAIPAIVWGQDSLNVRKVGQVSLSARGLALVENRLYVADESFGLVIFDVADPSSPVELGRLESDAHWTNDVAVAGQFAFLSDQVHGLIVVDVSDPSAPVEIAELDVYEAASVAVSGNYAFVGGDYRLSAVDVSTPTSPVAVDSFPVDWYVADIELAGQYAYLAVASDGVLILDASDPTNLTQVGLLAQGFAQSIACNGNVACVGAGYAGMMTVDISDPSSPTQSGQYWNSANGRGVFIVDDIAYLAQTDSGLRVIDIVDPANPRELGFYFGNMYHLDVLARDNYAFVAGESALLIYDVSAALSTPDEHKPVITTFSLHSIYPNPFNNTANITFDLPREVTGRLVVYDVLGRMTNTLFDGKLAAGSHQMQFNGNGLSSGTYFVRLETPAFSATQKAVLLK